ncbi:hypothetical protein GWI33_015490 [Rhynchophorus ferrugineus]|uniref:Cullin family profile domain-containing protein n=1 Tax=Rhynchophorus ferrugineus TaxID=354439 RepID=A0A834HZM3_RHYFE|nr:hypothetical protein GWI33_015490 [Rhynchophorus ferrugineus]
MISLFTVTDSRFCPQSNKIPPKSAKKSLPIVNFRGYPIIIEHLLENQHAQLTDGLKAILYSKEPDISLENLFQIVDNLNDTEHRERLFQLLTDVIEGYLNNEKFALLNKSRDGVVFCHLLALWRSYSQKVIIIKNVYIKYDRCCQNGLKYNAVQMVCTELFKNIIILEQTLKNRIVSQLLLTINESRQGNVLDKNEIDTIISILLQMDIYKDVFENRYLLESKNYFLEQSVLVKSKSVEEFLKQTNKCISTEARREYLPEESNEKVLKIIYEEMVANNLDYILDKGFESLMDSSHTDVLAILYDLCKNVPHGVEIIADHFQKYILLKCTTIVVRTTEKSMIQEIIEFKDKLEAVIATSFGENRLFSELLRTVFTKVINTKGCEPAQNLAKYLDSKLRSKYLNENALENILKKVMVIFRYIQEKDVFEAYYRKDLARRLIFGKSTSQDEERSVISKLKVECGEYFTAKMEGMFRDVNVSRDINADFKQYLSNVHPNLAHSDISVMVLTNSFWTSSTGNHQLVVPADLLRYQSIFRKYYCFTHNGRKLDWQSNLAHCIVRASFANSVKELQVSLFQTIVLLLFNDHDTLTTSRIQELTKIDPSELKIVLRSLSWGKTKILIKDFDENAIAPTDSFTFNRNFSDKLFRIKINQLQMKESIEEQKVTEKNILVDRQFQMDAAIVRILKRKRIISHNELVAEVYNVMNLPVAPQDLKKRIELLIDREYIKRDSDNTAMYTYIA